ncbi:Nuclear protein 1 [Lemmus lemmus]
MTATLPQTTSPSRPPLNPEDEDDSLDECDHYSLTHSYVGQGSSERSYQERSCCPHQPPEPWWTREEAADQVPEF